MAIKAVARQNMRLSGALTSYLGEMILASTTLSVLRDMAEYGGAMVFDDAENLADPKKSDPHKRALLLAGNRVGATIGIKEIKSRREEMDYPALQCLLPPRFYSHQYT